MHFWFLYLGVFSIWSLCFKSIQLGPYVFKPLSILSLESTPLEIAYVANGNCWHGYLKIIKNNLIKPRHYSYSYYYYFFPFSFIFSFLSPLFLFLPRFFFFFFFLIFCKLSPLTRAATVKKSLVTATSVKPKMKKVVVAPKKAPEKPNFIISKSNPRNPLSIFNKLVSVHGHHKPPNLSHENSSQLGSSQSGEAFQWLRSGSVEAWTPGS